MQNLSIEYIIWRLRQNIVSLLIECEDEIKVMESDCQELSRSVASNSTDEKKISDIQTLHDRFMRHVTESEKEVPSPIRQFEARKIQAIRREGS